MKFWRMNAIIHLNFFWKREFFFLDLICLIPFYLFDPGWEYVKILRFFRYWTRFVIFINKFIYLIFRGGSSHKIGVLLYHLLKYYFHSFKCEILFHFHKFRVSTIILLSIHILACLWIQAGTEPDSGSSSDI